MNINEVERRIGDIERRVLFLEAGKTISIQPDATGARVILRLTAIFYGFTVDQIKGTCRTAPLAWARQVGYCLCRRHTNCSSPTIAAEFGGRDHGTILHGCRTVEDVISTNDEAKAKFDMLEAVVKEHLHEA